VTRSQGETPDRRLSVERMCVLAGVSRAAYYRAWARNDPLREETALHLAVVLDAFSRKVVGWAMADHLRASLALDALEMALASREVIAGGLVHHSDRGVQYACGDYIARLEAAGVQPSMPRTQR
jgi:transposase InsO family protein